MSDPPLSVSDIEDQIVVRKVLMHDMVGAVYPQMLYSEIHKLLEMRSALISS